jgi:ribonuclease HII
MEEGRDKYLEELASGKYTHVIGADECGYGAWAGDLLVCAVAVPIKWSPILGLNDSKKLRPAKREELYYFLRERIPHEVATATPQEIDLEGVGSALKSCFVRVVTKLKAKYPGALVVLDGEVRIPDVEYVHFPRADGEVPAVMAASVIGKVIRDKSMVELAKKYPGYGFGKHAGYGSADHQEALDRLGPTPAHRASYEPIKKLKAGTFDNEPGISLDQDHFTTVSTS